MKKRLITIVIGLLPCAALFAPGPLNPLAPAPARPPVRSVPTQAKQPSFAASFDVSVGRRRHRIMDPATAQRRQKQQTHLQANSSGQTVRDAKDPRVTVQRQQVALKGVTVQEPKRKKHLGIRRRLTHSRPVAALKGAWRKIGARMPGRKARAERYPRGILKAQVPAGRQVSSDRRVRFSDKPSMERTIPSDARFLISEHPERARRKLGGARIVSEPGQIRHSAEWTGRPGRSAADASAARKVNVRFEQEITMPGGRSGFAVPMPPEEIKALRAVPLIETQPMPDAYDVGSSRASVPLSWPE